MLTSIIKAHGYYGVRSLRTLLASSPDSNRLSDPDPERNHLALAPVRPTASG